MDQDKKTAPMDKVFNDEKYSKLMRAVDAARTILDGMKEGEKTNIKDLTDRVSKELEMSVTQVSPFVGMAVQTYEGITVSRGRYGGIFKGIREKKEDNRERCTSCHQVIRKRRKKTEANGQATNAAATAALQTSDNSNSSGDEEEFEDDDDDLDGEDGEDEDNEEEKS